MPPHAVPLAPVRSHLRAWLDGCTRRLPSQCAICRRWPSQPVCLECLSRFGQALRRCPGCALQWSAQPNGPRRCPDCLRQPLPLESCAAAVNYAYPWSDLLTGLKFHQQTGWCTFLAGLLLERPEVCRLLSGLEAGDWLLPMPLSAPRLAERGFNQAWELARALHWHSGTAAGLESSLLRRLRHTPRQSELGRAQRLANLRGAFAVDPLQLHRLAGRRVVLVDDVMTSGASLATAAQALKDAGAGEVHGLVVARTPP